METACLWLGHIDHLDTLYPLGDVQYVNIHGIKRRDNGKVLLSVSCLISTADGNKTQNNNHHYTH